MVAGRPGEHRRHVSVGFRCTLRQGRRQASAYLPSGLAHGRGQGRAAQQTRAAGRAGSFVGLSVSQRVQHRVFARGGLFTGSLCFEDARRWARDRRDAGQHGCPWRVAYVHILAPASKSALSLMESSRGLSGRLEGRKSRRTTSHEEAPPTSSGPTDLRWPTARIVGMAHLIPTTAMQRLQSLATQLRASAMRRQAALRRCVTPRNVDAGDARIRLSRCEQGSGRATGPAESAPKLRWRTSDRAMKCPVQAGLAAESVAVGDGLHRLVGRG